MINSSDSISPGCVQLPAKVRILLDSLEIKPLTGKTTNEVSELAAAISRCSLHPQALLTHLSVVPSLLT